MLQRSHQLASLVLTVGLLAYTPSVRADEINLPNDPNLLNDPISLIVSPNEPLPGLESPFESELQPLRLEIQRSQRRVVLYQGNKLLKSYPIAVGRPGWETPKGTFEIQQKFKDPAWIHPLEDGVMIPGGDPENPLGRYWIGFWTDGTNWIGFHGTPNPGSVGSAASHGCIRMYNKDVEELFQRVSLGTKVTVVD